MLHGYLSSKKSFAFQTSYFKKYFDVHAVDLKGFGENADMKYPYALSDYVEDVKNYIAENRLVKPHVIGHSFGCRIIIKALAENNELFDKVVLTGCAGLKPKNTLKKVFKKTAFNVLKNFLSEKRLERFYSSDYLALSPVMKQSFKKIVNEHLDDKLKFINNSTLLVFGKEDTETPLYMAKRLYKGIKHARLVVIPDAGHFCFIDKPMKFNMEVREFLLS